jgi:predicted dithiol-disulfide oxidoreductase (DUF899 family)
MKEIRPFKKRMDWRFNWVSSSQNDFNFDFHVSFTPEQVRTVAELSRNEDAPARLRPDGSSS